MTVEVRSSDGSGLRPVADSLDIVSIGRDDERTVVVWVVVRPQARPPVVFATGSERCFVEGVHFRAGGGHESDVQRGWSPLSFV